MAKPTKDENDYVDVCGCRVNVKEFVKQFGPYMLKPLERIRATKHDPVKILESHFIAYTFNDPNRYKECYLAIYCEEWAILTYRFAQDPMISKMSMELLRELPLDPKDYEPYKKYLEGVN